MMRGANALALRISVSERMKFMSLACLAATLTLMVVCGPNAWSRLSIDRNASASTKRVMVLIRPSSMAMPMKELGG